MNLEVWETYKLTGDKHSRDTLIIEYLPLVKHVANKIAIGLPNSVDPSDLISYGTFGLIDAIKKFDITRGIKFETYAVTRIRGAILDELRAIDWIPRSVRSRTRSIERATAKLESDLHRTPTREEIAAELEWSLDQLAAVEKSHSSLSISSLDMRVDDTSDAITIGETISLPEDESGTILEEISTVLKTQIASLNERERIVLTLYYHEGLTLADIGGILGVTESRVCQIHTKAISELHEACKLV
jgi:RNA polymerase sigma factor for flagellar operon FliA